MQLAFILLNPQRGENVGAAARALKTMGFDDLRLVGKPLHREKSAYILAHGSHDILTSAHCVDTLEQAVADCDLVVGTTAKQRHQRRHHYSPQQLAQSLQQRTESVNRAAIVFGCEAHGLSNSAIAHCDLLTQVTQAAPQPSLNLAQAVMIYSFALSSLAKPTPSAPAEHAQYRALQHKVAKVCDALGVPAHEKSRRWAMERLAQANDKDVKFLHFLCTKLAARLPPTD